MDAYSLAGMIPEWALSLGAGGESAIANIGCRTAVETAAQI